MGDEITLAANNLFVIAAALAIVYRVKWLLLLSPGDEAARQTIKAWTLMESALLVRIGWWSLAIYLAGPGEHYHHWFVEYRHWPSVIAALLYGWGTLAFIRAIEKHHYKWKWQTMAAMVLIAILTATVGP